MPNPINLPPYGSEFTNEGAVLATLKAEPQPDPNMTVYVSPGGLWVNGRMYKEWEGGNSGVFTAPASNAKWDLLVFNYSGFLQIITGTPSADPQLPDAPRNAFVLCAVYLQNTTTKITTENLFDVRPVMNNCVFSHKDLEDRTDVGQHSIGAITNLQDTLDNIPTNIDMDAALAGKADVGGTSEPTFVLNQDFTGTPSTNVKVEVERGLNTNVDIRWNEGSNCWDFTNDGSVRTKIQQNLFVSAELTGTGSDENIAHTLGRIPTAVFVSVTDNTASPTFTTDCKDKAEITEITCDVGSTLSGGEYFTINSPSTNYYVWYTVDGVGTDPNIVDKTGIQVAINDADSADTVASTTASEIDSQTDLSASSSTNVVTVMNTVPGAVDDAADVDTGFDFSTTVQGVDPPHDASNLVINVTSGVKYKVMAY